MLLLVTNATAASHALWEVATACANMLTNYSEIPDNVEADDKNGSTKHNGKSFLKTGNKNTFFR